MIAAADGPRQRRSGPRTAWLLTAGLGAAVSVVLAVTATLVDSRNEDRLLALQVKETGAVLQAAIPNVASPLASAAAVAASSHGDPDQFTTAIAPSVGPRPKSFLDASLWMVSGGEAREVGHVGDTVLRPGAEVAPLVLAAAGSAKPSLQITGSFVGAQRGLAYAMNAGPGPSTYVVYAEAILGKTPRVAVAPDSPFSSLHYALYLGARPSPDTLLQTDLARLPLHGRHRQVTVPFGATSITLVATPAIHLGGRLSQNLWWIVGGIGLLLSAAAAFVAARLSRRRVAAEHLTVQVRSLLDEQRNIAVTLQQALLPAQLPQVDGLAIAVQYLPGVSGVDIGGDWYDVVRRGDDEVFFVVGDVSGRGLAAGTVMASLRFAIRAFVSEGHGPAEVLELLRGTLDIAADDHFATVLCGRLHLGTREVTLANAGHLPPLLVADGRARLVDAPPGAPIGLGGEGTTTTTTLTVGRGDTLLLYTDGLVERRGTPIDDRLDALLEVAARPGEDLVQQLARIVGDLGADDNEDDTALLGLRWAPA